MYSTGARANQRLLGTIFIIEMVRITRAKPLKSASHCLLGTRFITWMRYDAGSLLSIPFNENFQTFDGSLDNALNIEHLLDLLPFFLGLGCVIL